MTDENNVDHALTREPEADLWADTDEPIAPTKAASLIRGQGADDHFADAHELGARLRELRRRGRETPTELADFLARTFCA